MRIHNAVLAGLLCLAAALPVAAQKFQPKSIQFSGAPQYTTDELMAVAELKKGAVLDYAAMNEHSKKLMDTGLFATLAFKFDGVDLIFSLTPADGLLKARFDNLPLGTEQEVIDELHRRLPLFRGQVPVEGGYADAVRAVLEQMLSERKLPGTVTAAPAGDPSRRGPATMMSYAISKPAVYAGPVIVRGASLEWVTKANDMAVAAGTAPFDAARSQDNIERPLIDFYHDRGYAAAKVRATQTGLPTLDDKGIHVPFTVTIDEGRKYEIGAIQLPPGAPITQPEVDKILSGKQGSAAAQPNIGVLVESPQAPGPSVRLRMLWQTVAERYKTKGFLDVKVSPEAHFDDAAGKVNYTVTIETGPVYHLAFVKFEGVSDQLRALLIKNWQMMPGDVFDQGYAENFFVSVQKLDPVLARSLAGTGARYNVMADPQTHDVNMIIRIFK